MIGSPSWDWQSKLKWAVQVEMGKVIQETDWKERSYTRVSQLRCQHKNRQRNTSARPMRMRTIEIEH